jgi:hypothetical protein
MWVRARDLDLVENKIGKNTRWYGTGIARRSREGEGIKWLVGGEEL